MLWLGTGTFIAPGAVRPSRSGIHGDFPYPFEGVLIRTRDLFLVFLPLFFLLGGHEVEQLLGLFSVSHLGVEAAELVVRRFVAGINGDSFLEFLNRLRSTTLLGMLADLTST